MCLKFTNSMPDWSSTLFAKVTLNLPKQNIFKGVQVFATIPIRIFKMVLSNANIIRVSVL